MYLLVIELFFQRAKVQSKFFLVPPKESVIWEYLQSIYDAMVKASCIIHIIYFARPATWKGNITFCSNCYTIPHLP